MSPPQYSERFRLGVSAIQDIRDMSYLRGSSTPVRR